MKPFLLGVFVGALLLVLGALFLKRTMLGTDRWPRILASSVSPDKKWICEIVDVHPSPYVCQALVHAASYSGTTSLDRGFGGEAYLSDFDSSYPSSVRFTWDGDVVTIESFEPKVLKFKLGRVEKGGGRFETTCEIVSSPSR